MALAWDEIQERARGFSRRWARAHNEEAEAQTFETEFLRVFGVEDPSDVGDFEYRVPLEDGRNGYIDYLWKKHIAIEMKSRRKDLGKAYEQLKNYTFHLLPEEMPPLLLVCDFERFVLHHRISGEKHEFRCKDLHKNVHRFAAIAGYETVRVFENQVEVNVKAAEKMAKLHDALKRHGYEGHDLEVYLVRLLFCLFADDTGIFPKDSFANYVENSAESGADLAERLARLFDILNMPDAVRTKRSLLSPDLLQFRYINGGLFADRLEFADFDATMRKTLLECCRFDWNKISPAIFGAMFQGVMDKEQRRELGAHYTSEENILKLINPLFMDELWEEFDRVKVNPALLEEFHDKLSRLKFFDPACGCGNFLIITYRELRRLELELLKLKRGTKQRVLDVSSLLRVTVEQFYGLECEDFPCQIAQVGMWLMDHQMNILAAEQLGQNCIRLPLTQSAHIVCQNALDTDWESVVPKHELRYIIGNPPFNGYSTQTRKQKEELLSVYRDADGAPIKNAGMNDYVAAWFFKAAAYMANTEVRAAFVATNSICQGMQAATVWKPIFARFSIHIDFAYRTFIWNNEARGKAAVHCVIVGFSAAPPAHAKQLFDETMHSTPADNINVYLVSAPTVFIEGRTRALCDVPPMVYGNKPVDGGHLFISGDEYEDFITREPGAKQYIQRIYGSTEYINDITRYCLWLVSASPAELKKMPLVLERLEKVRQFRLASPKAATRKCAQTPGLFMEIRQPDSDYIIIPRHSSEKRFYIPFGFIRPDILVNDAVQIIPHATRYHFGVLISRVHMAWVRAVCGRIKSDYRYSKDIVYNNFPWPTASEEQKAAIAQAAQSVLDVRETFPDCTLSDLYDPNTMPPALLKAHHRVDREVMKAYGYSPKDYSEPACVADLMKRYSEITA